MLDTSDLAKFPFTKEASRYVQDRRIEIEELARDHPNIVDAAVKRVEEALEEEIRTEEPDEIEIPSYPLAVMIVMQLNDPFLKRRYALAEAKRAHKLLLDEIFRKSRAHLMDIAVGTFKWNIQKTKEKVGETEYEFSLYFTDYLRNVAVLAHEDTWKLVNRFFLDGRVYITFEDAARLLQEEIRRKIEKKLEERLDIELPTQIVQKIESLKKLLVQRKGKITIEEAPIGFMLMAFPPCIKKLYDAVFSGQNVPHLGRFTLTSFLLNTGMNPDEVIKLFSQLADFNSEMTRYQVEHIAGVRGSRTKYTSPNCSTLRTHGFCVYMDDLCKRVNTL